MRYPWLLAAAWLSLILATLLQIAVPRLLGTAIDDVLARADTSRLWWLAGAIVLVTALRGVFSYGNQYLAEAVSQRVAYDIRNAFYDKLQRLSFAFHDREHTGNLMSKATVDVEQLRFFINMGMVRSGQMLLLVAGVSVVLLWLDWRLALAALAFVPLVAYRAIAVSRRLRGIWAAVQADTGRMTTVLQENLAGMRVVKAFGADDHEQAKFEAQAAKVMDSSYTAARTQAQNGALMQVFFWAATGLLLWLGGRAVVDGRITLGELAQFILYTSLLVQPIRMMGFLVNTFARAHAAGQRLFEVLDAESPVRDAPEAAPLSNVRGEVAFEQVSFAYRAPGAKASENAHGPSGDAANGAAIGAAGFRPALRDASLRVAPGQRVALLGAPGSGKTTMVNLLARFYDVTSGRVTIDGIDVRDATVASVRRSVGIVQQDVYLFSASVRENIAYGREDAALDDVIAAAKTAQLHDEIMALPQGYDTVVGERGMTLSGGQRQRLSIARTILLDPPILVLDDSTSSVDAATEARIRQAMENVMRGRTTFVIAHRLSSVQGADTVAVLERGRIAEVGAARDLLARGGIYKHIAELQGAPTAAPGPSRAGGAG